MKAFGEALVAVLMRRGEPWVLWVALAVAACDGKGTSTGTVDFRARSSLPQPAAELTPEFLVRATGALAGYLGPQTSLLEIRTTGSTFSVQLRADAEKAELMQLDYVEYTKNGLRESRIYGPTVVAKQGAGDLDTNLFEFADINLNKMARSFKVAKLAVDPENGEIDQMIVRRFLPFSEHVRARIFVRSPRIPGSIDTNEEGTPLKR